jgi:hypothetical protein
MEATQKNRGQKNQSNKRDHFSPTLLASFFALDFFAMIVGRLPIQQKVLQL